MGSKEYKLGLKNLSKVGLLRPKTMPKYFLNNFEKVQNTTFWTPKMAKTWMSIWSKMVDFWTHFWFLSSNIALLGPWKNLKSFPVIAQDILKKEKINIAFFCQKFLDSIFWTSKMAKTRMSIWPKMVNFWTHFRFLSSNIALLGSGKKLKSFPLLAKDT